MAKADYWTGAHTTHRLKAHIVIIPKYRKRVLRGEIIQTIKTLFYEAAEVNGWNIEEFAIESDHIHMLLQYKPSKSISEILQIFKG
jgi:putative transposase